MFPGMGGRGGLNPKQLNAMMKQLGIQVENIDNVEEVIIRTATKEYVIPEAEVTVMTAPGTKTYQVVGDAVVRDREDADQEESTPRAAAPLFSEDDVKLVAEQANVPLDKAREALAATNGETAEAIMNLMDES